MPWLPNELRALRQASVCHLFSLGKISDLERNQDPKKGLFSCDLCTRVDDCEWAYHHDNLKGHCLWQEVNEENRNDV